MLRNLDGLLNEFETEEKQKLTQIKKWTTKYSRYQYYSFSKVFEFLVDRQVNFIEQYRIFRSFKSLSFLFFFVKSLVRLYEISDTPDAERTASLLDLLLRSSIHSLLVAEEKNKTRFYGNINGGEPTKKYLQLWLYFDDQINVVELF